MSALKRVVHVIILLSLAASHVRATSRHMVCNDVEDIFEGQSHLVGPSRNHNLRVGKQGPVGQKGEKGEPATIDLELLKQQITREVTEKNSELAAEITEMKSTLVKLQRELETGDVICRNVNGNFYLGKCYWLILHSARDVNFARAATLCAADGGEPGDVLDGFHFNMIEGMAQATMPTFYSHIWTGMTYDPQTKVMTTRGGKETSYKKWESGYPSFNAVRTHMAVAIYRDSTSRNGMWNDSPSYSARGVLCQK